MVHRANSDQPYSGASRNLGSVPPGDDLRSALDSLASCVAGSATDFGGYYRDSWLYGIIIGWDCEEAHEHDDICGGDAAMHELAHRHGWDDAEVERLRGYRRAFAQAAGGAGG